MGALSIVANPEGGLSESRLANVRCFEVFRGGDLSGSLNIEIAADLSLPVPQIVGDYMGGNATPDTDYVFCDAQGVRLGNVLTIPAGAFTALVYVTPKEDSIFEGAEA